MTLIGYNYAGTIANVALSYLLVSQQSSLLPSDTYRLSYKPTDIFSARPWEKDITIGRFQEHFSEFEKVQILHNFTTKLIEQSIDLDPLIAEKINEHIWDLL